jgi:lipoyl(octanoyl) transferase
VCGCRIRRLGLRDYQETWQAMRAFTEARSAETPDEIWLTEHPPIFTLGVRGDPEHILHRGGIAVLRVDRGGQATYHGPGQLVCYPLLDLQRLRLGVRRLVDCMEQAVVALLAARSIAAECRSDAPGVYVEGRKIASLGLRVRRGKCYHGLSLNVAMDLTPFRWIYPCGDANLEVTQIADVGVAVDLATAGEALVRELAALLKLEMQWA